ncbi:hypothetical protein [Caulobacter vibrioides]|nr:hypothetical protein [Caulobacter vibrioides]YP_002517519.2 hypothetical protein CCNA_02146 [Caulobacter vibrioides NA1000]ACL95611.2 hypothetical protein CCNA_02146 [Caulobacter vibrioides NA1000]QXZ50449.1 hypothetical protein KZH45_11025 [Caulobacter vibrioides]
MSPRSLALAALSLATALAGCAHERMASTGYQWAYLGNNTAEPRLAYGRPNSDDVVMMIRCQPGRDQIDLAVAGLSEAQLVLASGRTQSRFEAVLVDDPMSGSLLEARGKSSAAALEGFRKSGDLKLLSNGQRHSLAATSADREKVAAFFKACGV